jgi:hypothetical protein
LTLYYSKKEGVMNGRAFTLLIVLTLLFVGVGSLVHAQTDSSNVGTIILFKAYYLPGNVDSITIDEVDKEFFRVLSSLGPFDVEVVDFRATKENVEEIFNIVSNAKSGATYGEPYPVVSNLDFGKLAITPDLLNKLKSAKYIVFPQIMHLEYTSVTKIEKDLGSQAASIKQVPVLKVKGEIRAIDGFYFNEVKVFPIYAEKDYLTKFSLVQGIKTTLSDFMDELKPRIRDFLGIRASGLLVKSPDNKYSVIGAGKNFFLSVGNEFVVFGGEISVKDGITNFTKLGYEGIAKIWSLDRSSSEVILASPGWDVKSDKFYMAVERGRSIGSIILYGGLQYVTYKPVDDPVLQDYFSKKWNMNNRFAPTIGFMGDTEGITPWFDVNVGLGLTFASPLIFNGPIYIGLPMYPGGFKLKPYLGVDISGAVDQLTDYPRMPDIPYQVTVISLNALGGMSFEYRFSPFMSWSIDVSYSYPVLYPSPDLSPTVLREGLSFMLSLQLEL